MSKKLIFILGGLTLLIAAAVVTKRENNIKKHHRDVDHDISYKALGYDYDFDEDGIII
jgi:hypothetical protein